MLNHLGFFFFFCFFFAFFFLRLGLGQRRAVVIIGRWLLPSLVDTGDICCHYWQHILVFSSTLVLTSSIDVVFILSIWIYRNSHWKHLLIFSLDMETFFKWYRRVLAQCVWSKTSDCRGSRYRFFMFQMWLSGVLLRRSVQPSYLDNFHCSWIVNGIIGHYGQRLHQTFTCQAFVFWTFLECNRILHAMQHAQCAHKSVPFHWVSLLHSTVYVGYWTSQRVSFKIDIHQLNLYPRMCTFDGKLVFYSSNNLIWYDSPLKTRKATRTPIVPRVCVA